MSEFDQKELDLYYENIRDVDDEEIEQSTDSLIEDLAYNDDFQQDYDQYLEQFGVKHTPTSYYEFAYSWLIKKGIIYG